VPLTPDVPFNWAVLQAAWFARRFGAELILLHVVAPDMRTGEEVWDALEWGDAFDGIATSRLLRHGRPVRQIIEAAHAHKADLIVLATQKRWRDGADLDDELATASRRKFSRFLMRSVAAQVMDEAPCPVLVVPGLPDNVDVVPRHILCHLDLRERSARTLDLAKKLAAQTGARLTLMHVTVSTNIFTAGGKTPNTQMWAASFAQTASEKIAHLQSAVGTKAQVLIQSGEPGPVLAETAAKIGANLVISGHWRSEEYWQQASDFFPIVRHSQIGVLMPDASLPRRPVDPVSFPLNPRLRNIRDTVGVLLLAGGVMVLAWFMYDLANGIVCSVNASHPKCMPVKWVAPPAGPAPALPQ
jgi:nucleotide-binding universal stress UspA family protein